MPFRVPGLDLIDARVCYLLAPSSPERPFSKGAEMLRLKDRILTEPPPPDGIQLPPLREPESLDTPSPYVSSNNTTFMTAAELGDGRSEAVPPAPRFNRHGERVSHVTDRFVLGGSMEGYRIWRFRSPEPPIEFPVTDQGWANAWATFRRMDAGAA
jgi:hypothetical protein